MPKFIVTIADITYREKEIEAQNIGEALMISDEDDGEGYVEVSKEWKAIGARED